MKNIVLIGMRGSGKTTIGKLLATELNLKFVDIDAEIENSTGFSISEIVEKKGWKYFRKLESTEIARIGLLQNLVIATGGGAIVDPKNCENLKQNGKLIYLKTSLPVLLNRLDSSSRPSLTGKNVKDELSEIFKLREPIYESIADHIVNGDDEVERVVVEILSSYLKPEPKQSEGS